MPKPSFWDWYWIKVGLQPYQTEFLLQLRSVLSHNSVWYDCQPTLIQYKSQRKGRWMPLRVVRKAKPQEQETVLFAKLNFATRCKSSGCVTPSNTRIFAGDFQFGEFRAILRGVFVKKIHIFLRKEISVILRNYLTCEWKFFSRKILSERNYYKLEEIVSRKNIIISARAWAILF